MQRSAISWRSTEQNTVAKSSTEVELQSMSDEALWLRIIAELDLSTLNPTLILCDNKSSIEFGKDARLTHALKHINVKYSSIKENIEASLIKLKHVSTSDMVADMLTKPVPPIKVVDFIINVGLTNYQCTIKK